MKTLYSLVVLGIMAGGFSSCTLNVGTGGNTAGNPANAVSEKPAGSSSAAANTAVSDQPAKPAASNSDDPKSEKEQVQFAKGETDTTLDRTIAPGVTKTYMFNAKKGQHVWFKITEPTGKLEAAFNKNDVVLGKEIKEMLNANGDWAIYIYNNTDKPLNYKLWIGIE